MLKTPAGTGEQTDWAWWLKTWDRQQEHLLPDREERLVAIFDVVEAAVGAPQHVLDVAAGPGSITVRLLRRFPNAEVTLIDIDPAPLAIAAGVLGDDPRVRIVRADLAEASWTSLLPRTEYDVAVTANSFHWLREPILRRVYAELAGLLRPGGVLCNDDPMPPTGVNRLIAALERRINQVRPKMPEGTLDWESWWRAAASDPVLAPLVAERNRRFGDTHPPEFMPPITWHQAALFEAGFVEAGCVWRHGPGAIVAAVR